jgi:hypothetical protein
MWCDGRGTGTVAAPVESCQQKEQPQLIALSGGTATAAIVARVVATRSGGILMYIRKKLAATTALIGAMVAGGLLASAPANASSTGLCRFGG